MFLGIDIGTSSVKLCLASPAGVRIGAAEAPLSVQNPHPYWSEQDPAAWWQALLRAVSDLRTSHDMTGVQAIGLSGQMHGAVLLDAQLQVIRPAILWNDGRSHAECDVLQDRLPNIGQIAGIVPLPGFTAPKIMWLKQHEPDAHARIRHILLPKDYIGFRLHGAMVTDKSDAAGTLWLDQQKRDWSEEVAAASHTDLAALPECLEGTETAGRLTVEAAAALGLPAGIAIAAGGGDAAAGAVGLGAVVDGRAFVSLGTSGQLFVATASYRPNPDAMVHAYAHAVPGMWFQMAAMLNGARPLRWFADVCGAPVATLLDEAAGIDPETAPLFLPYLTGERSPHGDPHIRGGFYGLEDDSGRAEMMRGIVNAIAFSFADAADSLHASGTGLTGLSAIGGGTRSDLLLQTISDILGVAINREASSAVGPALGAAKLAACAVGEAAIQEIMIEGEADTVFTPRSGRGLREQLAAYRNLYRRLRNIHRDKLTVPGPS